MCWSLCLRSLAKLHGQHRDGTAIDALDRKTDNFAPAAYPEHIDQRQVMLGCWYRQHRVPTHGFVGDERFMVAVQQVLPCLFLESDRPFKRLDTVAAPCVCMQIVDYISAPEIGRAHV